MEPLDIANWYTMKPPEIKPYSDATLVRPPRYSLFRKVQSIDESVDGKDGRSKDQWERYHSTSKQYGPVKCDSLAPQLYTAFDYRVSTDTVILVSFTLSPELTS